MTLALAKSGITGLSNSTQRIVIKVGIPIIYSLAWEGGAALSPGS